MPRRRLHGETQRRRKKTRTRLLKRQETMVRVQATQKPAPFESEPRPEREDLEFLEAMRELEVRRPDWRRESTPRREHAERVHFLAEAGEEDLFRTRMAEMGVAPLDKAGGVKTGSPSSKTETRPAAAVEMTAESGGPAEADSVHPASPRGPSGTEPVRFEGGGTESMETLLAEAPFDPGSKYEGAPPPAPPNRGGAPSLSHGLEPDDELDLHGKTQEEAIAMVQNFLLVSHRRRLRQVLIITGKGLNSGQGGPVLKEAVLRWLDRNGSRFVRGTVDAPPRWGGAGALWLTIR